MIDAGDGASVLIRVPQRAESAHAAPLDEVPLVDQTLAAAPGGQRLSQEADLAIIQGRVPASIQLAIRSIRPGSSQSPSGIVPPEPPTSEWVLLTLCHK